MWGGSPAHLLKGSEGTAGVSVGQVGGPVRRALRPPLALALPGYDLLRSTRHFRQPGVSSHLNTGHSIVPSMAGSRSLVPAVAGHNLSAKVLHIRQQIPSLALQLT